MQPSENNRFAIIGSSGGGAFFAALDCLKEVGVELRPLVIVDRSCGLEDGAMRRGFTTKRIAFEDSLDFSQKASRQMASEDCKLGLLFFTRLICPDAFELLGGEIYNVHPSLLPAFPGINSVRTAFRANVGVLGASLHRVDNGVDTGPLVAQVAMGISTAVAYPVWEKISFLQKVYLTLVWVEKFVMNLEIDQSDFSPVAPIQAANCQIHCMQLRACYRSFCQLELLVPDPSTPTSISRTADLCP